MMNSRYNPEDDGVTHINVYSKGKTELGRFLSNFSRVPLETVDGKFLSVEGYWYWLLCDHPGRDALRNTYGFEAKRLGRELSENDWPSSHNTQFIQKITDAIIYKLQTSPKYLTMLKQTDLPLAHYYVYNGKSVHGKNCDWILQTIEWCRKNL